MRDVLWDAEAAFRRPKRALMCARVSVLVTICLIVASFVNLLVLLSR